MLPDQRHLPRRKRRWPDAESAERRERRSKRQKLLMTPGRRGVVFNASSIAWTIICAAEYRPKPVWNDRCFLSLDEYGETAGVVFLTRTIGKPLPVLFEAAR